VSEPAGLPGPDWPRFGGRRPEQLRHPPRGHPFRYVVGALDRAVERLSGELGLEPDDLLLDYGCAEMPYRGLFEPKVEVLGADLSGNPDASVEIGPDGTLPLADNSVDAVLSTQVLEHVTDPALYLSESARVLKPGGRLLLTTHGVMIYHPDPVDLWRWTWAGLERIVRDAGLEVVRTVGVMGPASTGLQLIQDGIYHRIRRPCLQRAFGSAMQALISAVARREPPGSARHNALIFAVVAERPGEHARP
jgi:SAM-dependent methyltransferase